MKVEITYTDHELAVLQEERERGFEHRGEPSECGQALQMVFQRVVERACDGEGRMVRGRPTCSMTVQLRSTDRPEDTAT